MFNVEEIRKDFPMLEKTMHNHPLVYLDNGATTLKPQIVIDKIVEYLTSYSGNAHRGDYDLSHKVDEEYESSREVVAEFINAQSREVVFTSGSTDSLNMIAFGFGRVCLNEGDEVLLTVAEHASNTLPWFEVAKEKGAIVNYIDLDEKGTVTLESVKKAITENTKIIALAQVTNVLGFEVPIKDICEYAHQKGIYVVVDGAQSVPHNKIDVKDLDCDFFSFSAHKMCGPTGIGILYGKKELLDVMKPVRLGGDSNARFDMCGNIQLKDAPYKFESGTQPIEAIFGLHAAIKYLTNIGMENIHAYEKELHSYAIEKMKKLDNIEIYNADNDSGIITFNVKGVFAQDAATYFNSNGIAVRSGQHCAKLLVKQLQTSATLRASIYFYTTKEEIDTFVEVCSKANMENCLNVFF